MKKHRVLVNNLLHTETDNQAVAIAAYNKAAEYAVANEAPRTVVELQTEGKYARLTLEVGDL